MRQRWDIEICLHVVRRLSRIMFTCRRRWCVAPPHAKTAHHIIDETREKEREREPPIRSHRKHGGVETVFRTETRTKAQRTDGQKKPLLCSSATSTNDRLAVKDSPCACGNVSARAVFSEIVWERWVKSADWSDAKRACSQIMGAQTTKERTPTVGHAQHSVKQTRTRPRPQKDGRSTGSNIFTEHSGMNHSDRSNFPIFFFDLYVVCESQGDDYLTAANWFRVEASSFMYVVSVSRRVFLFTTCVTGSDSDSISFPFGFSVYVVCDFPIRENGNCFELDVRIVDVHLSVYSHYSLSICLLRVNLSRNAFELDYKQWHTWLTIVIILTLLNTYKH